MKDDASECPEATVPCLPLVGRGKTFARDLGGDTPASFSSSLIACEMSTVSPHTVDVSEVSCKSIVREEAEVLGT